MVINHINHQKLWRQKPWAWAKPSQTNIRLHTFTPHALTEKNEQKVHVKMRYTCWTPNHHWHSFKTSTDFCPVSKVRCSHPQIGTLPIWGYQYQNWANMLPNPKHSHKYNTNYAMPIWEHEHPCFETGCKWAPSFETWIVIIWGSIYIQITSKMANT